MNLSEFSGHTLVAGTLLGIRQFRVHDGRLTGISVQEEWQPGLNHANCNRYGHLLLANNFPVEVQRHLVGPGHRPGQLDCTCGYYAYFNASYTPYPSDVLGRNMQGIIEASGLITVGSKGFRAEKATIKALHTTSSRKQRLLSKYVIPRSLAIDRTGLNYHQVSHRYPDVEWFTDYAAMLDAYPLTTPGPQARGTGSAEPDPDGIFT